MKIWAIIVDTFRESLARKIFIVFFAISTLNLLFFAFILNIDVVDGALAMVSVLGKQAPNKIKIAEIIIGAESAIAMALFTGGIFLSLFATANFVPRMLEKGTIDLLISKPLSRPRILLAKYLGSLAIVVLNIVYAIVGVWLVLSLKTGFWNVGFLYAAGTIILTFAILYCLIMFLGITTGSGSVAVMGTYLVMFLSPLLVQRENLTRLLSNRLYKGLIHGLYHGLPKVAELGKITGKLVAGKDVTHWMPLWSSVAFGAVLLAASVILFSRKDF